MPPISKSTALITDCWPTLVELARTPEKLLPNVENVQISGSENKFQRFMKVHGMELSEGITVDERGQTVICELTKHPLFRKGAIIHSAGQGEYSIAVNYEPATEEVLNSIADAYSQLIGGIHG